MVATERKMRAETEDELKELKLEKEALRSALMLVEGENTHLRIYSPQPVMPTHSRSSSQTAIKSRPTSLDYPPLPPSPSPSASSSSGFRAISSRPQSLSVLSPTADDVEETQPTPRSRDMPPLPATKTVSMSGSTSAPGHRGKIGLDLDEPSPWADVPSRSRPGSPEKRGISSSFASVAYTGMR